MFANTSEAAAALIKASGEAGDALVQIIFRDGSDNPIGVAVAMKGDGAAEIVAAVEAVAQGWRDSEE